MIATHGTDLARIWPPEHRRDSACPHCAESVSTTGLPDLAWTFERCQCAEVAYAHLTETVWHRACLVAAGRSS